MATATTTIKAPANVPSIHRLPTLQKPPSSNRWKHAMGGIVTGVFWILEAVSKVFTLILLYNIIVVMMGVVNCTRGWRHDAKPLHHRCTECQKEYLCFRVREEMSQTTESKQPATKSSSSHQKGNNPTFEKSRLARLFPKVSPSRQAKSGHKKPTNPVLRPVVKPYRRPVTRVASFETNNVKMGAGGIPIPVSTPSNQHHCCATFVRGNDSAQFCTFACYLRYKRKGLSC